MVAFPLGHLARVDELALLEGLSDVANALPTCDAVAKASQKMIAPVQVGARERERSATRRDCGCYVCLEDYSCPLYPMHSFLL